VTSLVASMLAAAVHAPAPVACGARRDVRRTKR
jgi:hypothetical protein